MKTSRTFIGVANDKGGVGKSLLSALLVEELTGTGAAGKWNVVEIEQAARFTQQQYHRTDGTMLTPMALLATNERSTQTEPSLVPLDQLWDFVPPEVDETTSSQILVDFGASAFQSFLLWGLQRRGLQPFLKAGFQFVFFIPVQGGDKDGADFFNTNAPTLLKLGKVVLVKNLREGANFTLLDETMTAKVPSITLHYQGQPLSDELQQSERRLTFKQLAEFPAASRRARIDAGVSADLFSRQFQDLRLALGLNHTSP